MSLSQSRVPFTELVAAADRLLDDCEDDYECLATRLGLLVSEVRDELLVSDLLNAWQVFYFFFRTAGDNLLREQLELEPASSLTGGIKIRENDFLAMIVAVHDAKPVIAISDGEKVVATFSGSAAYIQGIEFMESPEYQ
ncbi:MULTISPECIES: hypothetical protein [unclassified Methanoregula]|uniref:hypothetical protein n=1 Tax=unclassified Methanoregula TaxID=2649730 RepID=UPI0025EF5805|nr:MULTISPECIES: hypothetical protein [unclassified Methanoregula]